MIKFYLYYNERLNEAKFVKLNKRRMGLILRLAEAVKRHRPRNHIRKELTLVRAQMMKLS